MNKTTIFIRKLIEKTHGNKPFEEVILGIYQEEGTVRKAADKLGIPKSTFAVWLKEADKTHLEKVKKALRDA